VDAIFLGQACGFIETYIQSRGLPILQKSYAQLWGDARAHEGEADAWFARFQKQGRQLVTAGERDFEAALRAALRAEYGDALVLWGEECGDEPTDGARPIVAIDPVDGTAAMLASIARGDASEAFGFGVSVGIIAGGDYAAGLVAVLSGDGKGNLSISGAWRADPGGPALCNGRVVRVPGEPSGDLYCTAPAVMFPDARARRAFWALERGAARVVPDQNCVGFLRALATGGSAAEADLTIHDIAALVPILRAGGMAVTRLDGGPLTPGPADAAYTLHAAPPALHAAQQAAMRAARDAPPPHSALSAPQAAPHARKF
jgi:fructose-1,6-bisphosphatase/inositol monophosphatase family enzyme